MTPEEEVNKITKLRTKVRHIDQLKYDPNNIRLSHIKIDDERIIENYLLKVGSISDLEKEIVMDKTITTPLVILEDNTVLEGNRRLCACRQIIKKINKNEYSGLKKENFELIQCRIIPDSISQVGRSMYLITIHLRKKKAWRLFNRSKYIHDLHDKHGWSKTDLSKRLGITRPTLDKTIKSCQLTLEYKKLYGLNDNEWYKKYSYFWQLFTTKDLKKISDDEKKILEYMEWIFFDKFKIYQEVRKLPDILKNESAFKTFKNVSSQNDRGKSFRYALHILDQCTPELADPLFKKINKMSELFQNMSHSDVIKIQNDQNKMRIIGRLSKSINSLVQIRS